ncbi:hypothetical protein L1049_007251 [Liquidambar formosana]|uniref:Uncharacterized protein n=1 Tax=Liquidambar formosana TaxID=63359 RepID=A0AAP0WS92_LIQFO
MLLVTKIEQGQPLSDIVPIPVLDYCGLVNHTHCSAVNVYLCQCGVLIGFLNRVASSVILYDRPLVLSNCCSSVFINFGSVAVALANLGVVGPLWHENLKVLFVTNGTSKIHYYTEEHHGAVNGKEDAPITLFTCDMSASGDGIVRGRLILGAACSLGSTSVAVAECRALREDLILAKIQGILRSQRFESLI